MVAFTLHAGELELDLPQFLIHGQGGRTNHRDPSSPPAKLPPVMNCELRRGEEEHESDQGNGSTRVINGGVRQEDELEAAKSLCELRHAGSRGTPDGENEVGLQTEVKEQVKQELRCDTIQEETPLEANIVEREATECVYGDSVERKAAEARQVYEEATAIEGKQHQRQEGGSEAGRVSNEIKKALGCDDSGGRQKQEGAEETTAMVADTRKDDARTRVDAEQGQDGIGVLGTTEERHGGRTSAGEQRGGGVIKEFTVDWEKVKTCLRFYVAGGQNVDACKRQNGARMSAKTREGQEDRASRGDEVEEEVAGGNACVDSRREIRVDIDEMRALEAGHGDQASTIRCVLRDSETTPDTDAGQGEGGTGKPEQEGDVREKGASDGVERTGEAGEDCNLEPQTTQEGVRDGGRGDKHADLLNQGIEGIDEIVGQKCPESRDDEKASEGGGRDDVAVEIPARHEKCGEKTVDTDEVREETAVSEGEQVWEARSPEAERAGPPISQGSEVTERCACHYPCGEKYADSELAGTGAAEEQQQGKDQKKSGGDDGWEWARERGLDEQQAADTRVASYSTEYEWEDVEPPVECARATEPVPAGNTHASLSTADSDSPSSDPISDDVRSTGFSPEAFVEMAPETFSNSAAAGFVDSEALRSVGDAGETRGPSPVWQCSPGVFTSATQAGVALDRSPGLVPTEECIHVMDGVRAQSEGTLGNAEHAGCDGGALLGEDHRGLAEHFSGVLTEPAAGCGGGARLEVNYGSTETREWFDELNGTEEVLGVDGCVEQSMPPQHRSLLLEEDTVLSGPKPTVPPLSPCIYPAVSPCPSVSSEAVNIEGVEVRKSGACGDGGGVAGCEGGESGVGDATGLGVFCEGATKRGGMIFREDALLKVSRSEVDHAVWSTVARVTKQVHICIRADCYLKTLSIS